MALAQDSDLASVDGELVTFFRDPSLFPDPYPMFRRLRDLAPVHWSGYNAWVLTGYPETEQFLVHPAVRREPAANQQYRYLAQPDIDPADTVEAIDMFLSSILNLDPPRHTRIRRLVSHAFTPRTIATWEPRVEAIVDDLVAQAAEKSEFDLMTELAYPLPKRVICDLLGVPFEDMARATGTPGSLSHSKVMTTRGSGASPAPDEDLRAKTQQSMLGQVEYFRELIEERRKNLGTDLLSVLIQAEEAGDRLSMEELLGTVVLLIGAGFETTANLIGNGTLALLRDREQFELLRDDPDLMPQALEEILRHETPNRGQSRTVDETIELGGKTIAAGEQVMLMLNAANRDPRVFDDPDRFDIRRKGPRHITFGAGIHFCIGSSLARLEARLMFGKVLERLGDLQLATDEIRWRPAYARGVVELPVSVGKVLA
ncbi:cytochrome P450 [Amycolatopsis sp. GM8]|uniref:cytochrome P450 n=1 Tax=Amycolatopsis sp. GM8 TaxID=2896530 RepID=UPI001F43E9F2|nr:cytochrome P450 [Amycolatopsis sp. GM8]